MADEPLRLPCPKCGSVLKLRDRRVLGKVGRCPSCRHRFKLEEPEPVVELELDSPAGVASAPGEPDPPPPAETPAPAAPAEPAPPAAAPAAIPVLAIGEPEGSVLKQRRRSKKRSRTPEIVVGVLSALGLGAAAYFVNDALNAPPPGPRQASEEVREERAAESGRQRSGFAATAGAASAVVAGDGEIEPITLRAMPAGVSLLVHMRPAELWGPKWAATRDATGPLAPWAAGALESLTGYPPQAMEECTVGWVMGPRGSVPQPAVVFTFAQPPRRSELVLNLPGTLTDDYAVPMKIDGDRAIVVLNDPDDAAADPIGLAIAPSRFAPDLDPEAALTAPSVEGLLPATDRTAPLTVLFQPLDLDLHRDTLFPEAVRPLADAFYESFGGWSEAVAVGFGPAAGGGGDVAVTLAVRGTTDDVASTLGPTASKELEALPERLLAHVRTLVPATVGRQRLVGRLPAMVAAAVHGRVGGAEGRVYRAAVKLPPQAGPNLALASLLTWDAGLSGVRSAEPAATVAAAPADNATLADKLDRPLEIDFRRTPLKEAFEFIAGEAKFPVEVDGNAIKNAGMTQNIPQEFALGRVPAKEAIARLLQNHPKLAVVADQPAEGTLLVTTRDAAAAADLTPLPLGPDPAEPAPE